MSAATSGYAEVGPARIYYEAAGVGSPVVLAHAGIADRRMWDDQFPVLAERYRVIRYDLRGAGNSPMVAGPYTLHGDLEGLMDVLDIDRAAIVGASTGGAAAINLALEHPERVHALVLAAPNLYGYRFRDRATIKGWELVDEAVAAGDYEKAARIEVGMWVDGDRAAAEVEGAVRDKVREMLLPTYAPGEEGEEQAPDPLPMTRVEDIRVPTLVIVGDHDLPDMHAIATILEERVEGAERVVLLGAAHLPSMERPEEFNRIVLEFLSRV